MDSCRLDEWLQSAALKCDDCNVQKGSSQSGQPYAVLTFCKVEEALKAFAVVEAWRYHDLDGTLHWLKVRWLQ